MKPIYKRKLLTGALAWAGCLVLFFMIYMFVLSPQKKTKRQFEKQLAERKQVYSLAQKASKKQVQIQLNEQIEKLRNKLNDFSIDFKDSANLIFDIGQIASEKKLASFSIKGKEDRRNSKIPNCDGISEYRIDVKFTSSFNQFAAFLNALERHRPVVFIDDFTITRSKHDDSNPKVSMNLSVFVTKQLARG